MASTDDLLREVDEHTGREQEDEASTADARTRRARLRARTGRLFSPRRFLGTFAAAGVGLLVAGAVVPSVVPLGGLLGVFAATFALGLAGWRRYVEAGLAGGAVAGVALLLGHPVISMVGAGAPLTAFGAGTGAAVALLGHYLGRDLRAGLTRDL
jgi:hypothetical protein